MSWAINKRKPETNINCQFSVIRLGFFESSWHQIFTKVAQIFVNYLGYFAKHYFLSKNFFDYCGLAFEEFWLLFIPTSGRTEFVIVVVPLN